MSLNNTQFFSDQNPRPHPATHCPVLDEKSVGDALFGDGFDGIVPDGTEEDIPWLR